MADFDQLIRDKANQAQYDYKPSAWRSFAKKAGLKTGPSGLTIAAISGGAVVVAGAILWGVLTHSPKSVATEPAQTPMEVVVPMDTLSVENESETPAAEPVASTKPQSNCPVQSKPTELKKDTVVPTSEASQPTAKEAPKKKKTTRQPYLRPVTISADTITQMTPTDEQLRKGNSRVL